MNCLVETKKEYTIQLNNILSPLIFNGVHSLYTEACKYSPDNSLKQFQHFLRNIPDWQQSLLESEVDRIKLETKLGDYVEQLFKIVISLLAGIVFNIRQFCIVSGIVFIICVFGLFIKSFISSKLSLIIVCELPIS